MARDRLIFIASFAFLALAGAFLFNNKNYSLPTLPEHHPIEGTGIHINEPLRMTTLPVKGVEYGLETLPLEPGKIAVPFELRTESAIAQFLSLGKFMDIIFTSKSDIGFGAVTFTLLNNIKILGIGRDADGKVYSEKNTLYKANAPVDILLEMTPKQAEILSYAQKAGYLSFGIGSESLEEPNELVGKLLLSASDENFNSILVTHMMRALFPNADIKIISTPKGYIVTGKAPNETTIDNIVKILEMLGSGGNTGKSVVNLLEKGADFVEVLVAKKELKINEHLTQNDFGWTKVPIKDLTPALIIRNPQVESWLTNAFTAKSLSKGQLFSLSDIIWPSEMAKYVDIDTATPGKRVVPFEISTRSPIAQVLNPGTLVDVKFTSKSDIGFNPIHLNLLNDIKVLSLGKDNSGRSFDAKEAFYKGDSKVEIYLEMDPEEARIFSFAQSSGIISLELANESYEDRNNELTQMLLHSESLENFQSILITYMIRTLFPNVNVQVIAAQKGFIVDGQLPDPQIAAKILEIISKLVPGGEKAVISLLEIKPQQVLVCVKVFEVVKEIQSKVGLNWQVLFQNTNQVMGLSAVFPAAVAPNYAFNASQVSGNYTLSALVDMLEANNLGKVLAEPNLTTVSGETAHFFAGGEFPILIPQGGTLLGTVTVEYKKYGVLLDFTPTVDLNGLITMHIVPEVSNLDKANSVILSGFVIPALLSRKVDTIVKLWSGQSYVIAGLYLDEMTDLRDSLYGLNKIPLIGAIFGTDALDNQKTELMITVTPYLINDGVYPAGILPTGSTDVEISLTNCDGKYECSMECAP